MPVAAGGSGLKKARRTWHLANGQQDVFLGTVEQAVQALDVLVQGLRGPRGQPLGWYRLQAPGRVHRRAQLEADVGEAGRGGQEAQRLGVQRLLVREVA